MVKISKNTQEWNFTLIEQWLGKISKIIYFVMDNYSIDLSY